MTLKFYRTLLIVGLMAFATPPIYSQSSQSIDSEKICDMIKLANHKVQNVVGKIKLELDSLSTKINDLEIALKEDKLKLSSVEKQELDLKLKEFKAMKTKLSKDWFEPNGKIDNLIVQTHELVEAKMNDALEKLNEKERLELMYLFNNCD
jgi:cell shape-determining protein MreC